VPFKDKTCPWSQHTTLDVKRAAFTRAASPALKLSQAPTAWLATPFTSRPPQSQSEHLNNDEAFFKIERTASQLRSCHTRTVSIASKATRQEDSSLQLSVSSTTHKSTPRRSIKHRCLRAPGHLIEGEGNLVKNARRLGTASLIDRSRGGDPSLNIPEAVQSYLVKSLAKAENLVKHARGSGIYLVKIPSKAGR
jgi:hypothetical protein